MSRYISMTWLWSVILYPLAFLVWIHEGLVPELWEAGGYLLPFLFLNLVFALPSLLMGLVAGFFLEQLAVSLLFRFFLWLLSASVSVILNAGFLELLAEQELLYPDKDLWLPGIITVTAVSVARWPAFKQTTDKDENNLEQPE